MEMMVGMGMMVAEWMEEMEGMGGVVGDGGDGKDGGGVVCSTAVSRVDGGGGSWGRQW
jgi:hypothetical protein